MGGAEPGVEPLADVMLGPRMPVANVNVAAGPPVVAAGLPLPVADLARADGPPTGRAREKFRPVQVELLDFRVRPAGLDLDAARTQVWIC